MIFYLLLTGCPWRMLPREFPRPGTVDHYFRAWKEPAVFSEPQRALHEEERLSRGCLPCLSVVTLDSQSVKTTERGGTRGLLIQYNFIVIFLVLVIVASLLPQTF